MPNTITLHSSIYPLEGISLSGSYPIADHINLSGSSPKHIGFLPLTELYIDKHNPDAIIVACLKQGSKPSPEETSMLRSLGVQAYSYDLLEEALYAAAQGFKVKATGFVPRLPQGFSIGGAATGIKPSGRKDLGLIYSQSPCLWSGVFTHNLIRAACVDHNMHSLGQTAQAIVCNSGNANACTGLAGSASDLRLRAKSAAFLDLDPATVLSASTGKIGINLEVDSIDLRLLSMGRSLSHITDFAEAILTTDTRTKLYQSQSMIGFAKGSGMIAPNMATMLAFVISDARLELSPERLRNIIQEISADTFNSVSVDNDTSTNDMFLFMSNQLGEPLSETQFQTELHAVCSSLARQIAIDAEGASKLIELSVYSSLHEEQARTIAKTIINSPLVKSAIFGCDPNWGRIMAAAGRAAAELGLSDEDLASAQLSICGDLVFERASPSLWIQDPHNRTNLSNKMRSRRQIDIALVLDSAINKPIRVWGCDLSYDYVRINAEYFT